MRQAQLPAQQVLLDLLARHLPSQAQLVLLAQRDQLEPHQRSLALQVLRVQQVRRLPSQGRLVLQDLLVPREPLVQ